MKAYKLSAATIKNVKDVAAILNGLGLVMRDDAPMFSELSKYFTEEVTPPEAIAEGEGPIAQED